MVKKPKASAAKPKTSSKPDPNRVFKGGMPTSLGMRLVSLTKKKVIAEMPVKDQHRNWNGRVNGGAIMSLADATGAAGAVANMPPGHRGGTLESKTNFFAAGVGPVIRAVAIPLHIGRTTSVWQTTLTNSGDGSRVAIVTQTQMCLPIPPNRGGYKDSD
ncbi:MAG: PaaI family thioesterase [Burkholderiales bacterium]